MDFARFPQVFMLQPAALPVPVCPDGTSNFP
jgi:hypothetical protein